MRKLRVGIVDLVTRGPTRALYARIMHANLASIMPQVVGVWCEAEGHEVTFICYTGFEDLVRELPADVDLVFIGAFTEAALLAYSLSNLFRSRGAVTVLGGPHARCYPEDARQYFDYVLGFTDRTVVREVLEDCAPHRPEGRQLAAGRQPLELPGVRERWKFIAPTIKKAPLFKLVPMLGSLGCPYTCSFCIDSVVPYQPLDLEVMQDDLRFLRRQLRRPHVVRLKRNGFKALLPGVESWFDLGNKSKTGKVEGNGKVEQVSEHVNMILRHIPYVQTNFVLGLDCDHGPEPFELTKLFVDLTPGAFPGYSLLSAFGRAAPLNLQYQRSDRVLPFPFHFLDNNHAMNVKPQNYSWQEFYDHVIDLTRYTFSRRAIVRRFRATPAVIPRWMNVVRALSSEGYGRIRYHSEVRHRLDTDPQLRGYFDRATTELPAFYEQQVRRDLGPLWQWLPQGALSHGHHAYLKAEASTVVLTRRASTA